MDDEAYRILRNLELPGINPISLEVFERNDEALKIAKTNRSRIEYYFTCTPSLPLFILNNWPEVDLITYLDADLFFFQSPESVFQEMDNASVGIIGHRFPPKLKRLELHGIYNVGWLTFRRDDNGINCLNWWRDRCIEWCYDRTEDGRYADQKYLDDWPTRFKGVKVIEHKGANLAPWNVDNYRLSPAFEKVLVDDQPLVFFHFHRTKEVIPNLYTTGLSLYHAKSSSLLRNTLFRPYIKSLIEAESGLANHTNQGLKQGIRELNDNPIYSTLARIKSILRLSLGLLLGDYIFVRREKPIRKQGP
ncbi:MAG: hypothetical protein WC647_18575 [Desulfomonilaceae bacterium]|jgi:hypothetical protein